METLTALSPEVDSTIPLPVGTRLQEFVIERVIGVGGFGIVYQAKDSLLRRSVAIKEYMPSSMAVRTEGNTVSLRSASFKADFDTGKATFIEEARMLAQFKHPALIEVHRFWEDNRTAYMVTPFYSGRTLDELLSSSSSSLNEADFKRLLLPILDALAHMHAEQVYHRDISPDNIMVLDSGAAILLDLGAARRLESMNPKAFTVLVKPGYAPIEQYAGEIAGLQGPWTDLYGWGASAYFALMGKPPPPCASRVMSDTISKLAEQKLVGFSTEFLAAIDATLAVRPDDRPQSVEALKALLAIESFDASLGDTQLGEAFEPTLILPREAEPSPMGEIAEVNRQALETLESIPPNRALDKNLEQEAVGLVPLAPAKLANLPKAQTPPQAPQPVSNKRSMSTTGVALGLASVCLVAGIWWASKGEQRPQPGSAQAVLEPQPQPQIQPQTLPASVAVAAVPSSPATQEAPAENQVADKPALVRLNLKPWGEVRVNGVQKGVSPPLKSLSLEPGEYKIEVRNADYPVKNFKVNLTAGQKLQLNHTFAEKALPTSQAK